jgi:hypothetical protein
MPKSKLLLTSSALGVAAAAIAFALSLPTAKISHHVALGVAVAALMALFLCQSIERRRYFIEKVTSLLDADFLTALFVGALAGLGAYLIPWLGSKLWLPVFLILTAFMIVTAKIRSIGRK